MAVARVSGRCFDGAAFLLPHCLSPVGRAALQGRRAGAVPLPGPAERQEAVGGPHALLAQRQLHVPARDASQSSLSPPRGGDGGVSLQVTARYHPRGSSQSRGAHTWWLDGEDAPRAAEGSGRCFGCPDTTAALQLCVLVTSPCFLRVGVWGEVGLPSNGRGVEDGLLAEGKDINCIFHLK